MTSVEHEEQYEALYRSVTPVAIRLPAFLPRTPGSRVGQSDEWWQIWCHLGVVKPVMYPKMMRATVVWLFFEFAGKADDRS
jgi:hypothetical protein